MQSCVRYNDAASACQFCAIGTSLKEGPDPGAQDAGAAGRGGGGGGAPRRRRRQLVLTTGTPATAGSRRRPPGRLRGGGAGRGVPSLPIQVQCEPPDDFAWLARLNAAGADTLGMHLEAVEPAVRAAVMPGQGRGPGRLLPRAPTRRRSRCSGAAR